MLLPHPLNDPTEFGSLQDLFCISRKEGCVDPADLRSRQLPSARRCSGFLLLQIPGGAAAAAGHLQEVLPVLLQPGVRRETSARFVLTPDTLPAAVFRRIALTKQNFTLRYDTNIPRQVVSERVCGPPFPRVRPANVGMCCVLNEGPGWKQVNGSFSPGARFPSPGDSACPSSSAPSSLPPSSVS